MNFKNISNVFINDTNLSKIDLYVLVVGYLEEVFCFIDISTNDNIEEIAKETEDSDSKEEKKKTNNFTKREEKCLGCYLFY